MITTADTIQGEYTKDYKLGLAISNTTNLAENIKEYLNSLIKKNMKKTEKNFLKISILTTSCLKKKY